MLYKKTIGTGKNLIMLHGWGFNSRLFEHLTQTYQHKYRITLIDLPGHGKSDTKSGGLDNWCDEIIKNLPKKPILLGWSLGGLLAIRIARQIPVAKLILVASTPNFIKTGDWQYGIDANYFKQFANALSLNTSKGLKRFVRLQTQDATQFKTLDHSIEQFPASKKALSQGLEILQNSKLTLDLMQLTNPIEVILGKRDTLVPCEISNWYGKAGIKSTLLDTGHLPFLHKDFTL